MAANRCSLTMPRPAEGKVNVSIVPTHQLLCMLPSNLLCVPKRVRKKNQWLAHTQNMKLFFDNFFISSEQECVPR